MNPRKNLLYLPAALILVAPAAAIQIDWGSPTDSIIRDSFGNPLDDTFAIQLGYFVSVLGEEPFVPSVTNVADWSSHWKVFDQAEFDPETGYFSSSALLNPDGSSSSPAADHDAGLSFSNQDAYIWIHNSENPVPGSEWFLARSATASAATASASATAAWHIPAATGGCCDDRQPLTWSVTDLDGGDVPTYGKQGNATGAGEFAVTGVYDVQTFTFVPEPSAVLLLAIGGAAVVLRRRRTAD